MQAQADDGLLPKLFAEINPQTGVAVKSVWVVFAIMSVPAFLLNLEQITKVISVGNLMNYSFVQSCGIALRFRDRETQTTERSDKESYVWCYLISSFILAILILNFDGFNAYNIFVGIITAVLFIELCRAE